MNTEDLKALGLSEDQVKSVFAMHGKAMNASKKDAEEALKKVAELEAEKAKMGESLKKLEATAGDAEKLKAEIDAMKKAQAEAEAKSKADAEAAKAKAEIDARFSAVVGDKKMTDIASQWARSEFEKALADPANKGKGDADIFGVLTKDKEGVFKSENPVTMGGMGNPDTGTASDAALRAAMGLPPVTNPAATPAAPTK